MGTWQPISWIKQLQGAKERPSHLLLVNFTVILFLLLMYNWNLSLSLPGFLQGKVYISTHETFPFLSLKPTVIGFHFNFFNLKFSWEQHLGSKKSIPFGCAIPNAETLIWENQMPQSKGRFLWKPPCGPEPGVLGFDPSFAALTWLLGSRSLQQAWCLQKSSHIDRSSPRCFPLQDHQLWMETWLGGRTIL